MSTSSEFIGSCISAGKVLIICLHSLRLEAAAHPELEHEVAADRVAHVVGRERVLVGEQLMGAHHQGDAATLVAERRARAERGEPLAEGLGAERDEPVEERFKLVAGRRPAVVAPAQGEQHLVRPPRPLPSRRRTAASVLADT